MIPALSFVCSHGRTATTWMTRALDSHPDIAAVHGPISPPVAPSAAVSYEEVVSKGWDTEKFFAMTVDEMVNEMQAFSTKRFKVRVHALNAYQLLDKVKRESPLSSVRAVTVIRHPIPRIESYQRSWLHDWDLARNLQQFFTNYYLTSDLVKNILTAMETHGVSQPETLEDKLFVCAVTWLANDFRDFETEVPVFVQERLTHDPEYWISFLRAAFGPTIAVPFTHLQNVQKLEAKNVQTKERMSSAEVYAKWPDWKRFAFRHFSILYNVPAMYRRFGYEFEY
jgi:hypothetical protein